ncbi:hypothetical protein K1719_007656 [Acacia pycnantha]|nr:hypothetical protein K1719_007656 [Acacia pycnantha]
MQTLSARPSNVHYGAIPPLSIEEDPYYLYGCATIRRKKKLDPVFSVSQSRSIGVFYCSRNSRVNKNVAWCGIPNFDLKCGIFLGYTKLKFAPLLKPKNGVGFLAPLAWALDDQAVGENNDSMNNSSLDSNRDGINCLNLDEVQDSNYEQQKQAEEDDSKIDVRALAFSLQSAKTVDEMEEILKDKGELPPQVYSTIIRGFGKEKKMDSALILMNLLNKKRIETNGSFSPNLFIYNSLLGAVKQSQEFAEMETIMNEMDQAGITPNVVTYNTLMAIYIEKGEGGKALSVFEEIHNKGLTPSAVSYSQAMLAYRRMEDGHGALNFFVKFREKYHQGEIGKDGDGEDWGTENIKLEKFTIRVCYQVMRRWLVSYNNLSHKVIQLLDDMDKAGIHPVRADLEKLVWACTREDHYTVAKDLYSRIRTRYSKISLSVCNHAIWLMGKAKKWWAALEIYEDLLDKGPKPNNLSYELIMSHFNVLLSAAKKRGIWRWGVRLLNKMEDKGLKPGSKEWNAVLIACSKASETSAAVQIFKRMVENGEKPTIISYGALLSALEKGKLYDEALRVWDHMVKVGFEPNAYAYTIMASIHTALGNFNRVDDIISEMVASGIELTVVTYNAIISGCARNGMGSAAYEWFHRMKVQKIAPNEITYAMLIEALARDGKPKLAFELYMRAHNEGLHLSTRAYDAVLESSRAYGATIDSSLLGPRPPEKKKKVQIRKTLTEFYNLADVPKKNKPFDRSEIYYSQSQTEGSVNQ